MRKKVEVVEVVEEVVVESPKGIATLDATKAVRNDELVTKVNEIIEKINA